LQAQAIAPESEARVRVLDHDRGVIDA
jgi:hypothetical protein